MEEWVSLNVIVYKIAKTASHIPKERVVSCHGHETKERGVITYDHSGQEAICTDVMNMLLISEN